MINKFDCKITTQISHQCVDESKSKDDKSKIYVKNLEINYLKDKYVVGLCKLMS